MTKTDKKTNQKLTVGGMTTKNTLENKTGAWRSVRPVITDKCIGCGICINFCPEGCIEISNKKAVIDYNYCKGCMICATVCPQKAVDKGKEK